MFGRRILILVPHPDDEIVACAATIGRARQAGAEIFSLYLTHGCVSRETMWPWRRRAYPLVVARRRAEAEDVARFLDIRPAGWLDRPARHVWRDLPRVRAEIEQAVAQHDIDQLWVPAFEGGNADHDAINAVAQLFKPGLSVLEFAEYNYSDGRAHSHAFPFPNGQETVILLSAAEQAAKREALSRYPSENLNLSYVKCEREVYRPLGDYDYSKPAHPGVLWYARFQWVPFRHPQVDFTNPTDVAAAITTFLSRASA
ncbi:MAG: PIG-L family deacetylase [Alphaproteobacteria bacterium]|nr:PIG-L family deacetylase [Alphaproteobacteria bacterium]MBV8548602.1 PIG-L family deacetylase [Alphaproteobacteria bacterium]